MQQNIYNEIKKRVLVLDGAMGTMIQRYNLQEKDYRGERFSDYPSDLKGNNDLLSLTQANIIGKIHEEYLEAGADIVETNTFNANRISMADYQMEELAYEINKVSAEIAKKADAPKPKGHEAPKVAKKKKRPLLMTYMEHIKSKQMDSSMEK